MKTGFVFTNNHALPLGYMIEESQVDLQNQEANLFTNQNIFIGGSKDYFSRAIPSEVKYNNLSVREEGERLHVKKDDPNQEGSIEWTFDVQGEKQFYTLLSAGKGFPGYGETTVFVNGRSLGVYPTFHNEGILDLGAFANETVTVKVVFSVPETDLALQLFCALDMPSFAGQIGEIREQSLQVTSYSDTVVEGNITAEKANPLFLSIPYDRGWQATVDGEPVQVVRLGGFIGIHLGEGTHHIRLNYIPPGFTAGSMISICTLLGILVFLLVKKRPMRMWKQLSHDKQGKKDSL
ncbi:YfhO family protein [Bacillaceae bacterium Marseille-Q3522]|nr:YfhO family protein [Bacillaceae bacterium Marseille-Q3522]